MQVTYGEGFAVAPPQMMRQKVESLQQELSKLPQYEPETKHYFHGGMYCREVFRHAGVLVVGAVHKKEHFYLIVSGTVAITDGEGNVQEFTGPHLFSSKPGTKRAVYALTDAVCMTFHVTEATTVEDAEAALVEADASTMYSLGNKVKIKELS
jgi:predicted nuclease with RNAse H fold